MALNDPIEEVIAPVAQVEPTAPVTEPEVIVADTPEPQVHQAPSTSIAPLHDMIAAQAAERLARSAT